MNSLEKSALIISLLSESFRKPNSLHIVEVIVIRRTWKQSEQ